MRIKVVDARYLLCEPAALNADSEDNEDEQTDEDDLSDVTFLPGTAFVQLVRADVQPKLESLFDRHREQLAVFIDDQLT